MMYWGNGSGWGLALMAVSTVIFWGLIVTALVLIIRSVGRDSRPISPEGADAQRILAERFARGEIDETEYRNRSATLRGSPT